MRQCKAGGAIASAWPAELGTADGWNPARKQARISRTFHFKPFIFFLFGRKFTSSPSRHRVKWRFFNFKSLFFTFFLLWIGQKSGDRKALGGEGEHDRQRTERRESNSGHPCAQLHCVSMHSPRGYWLRRILAFLITKECKNSKNVLLKFQLSQKCMLSLNVLWTFKTVFFLVMQMLQKWGNI